MGDTLLATLPLEDKEITYTIYLYIDSTVSLGNYNDKTYSGYIYATTEQTSTVGKNEDNTKKNLGLQTIDFDYLGNEQQFVVPQTGTYQLETWGAQGGLGRDFDGGYGGYSVGTALFKKIEVLYLNIGGKGGGASLGNGGAGGYNGGGAGGNPDGGSHYGSSGGGGATHIAASSGLLLSLESKKNSIFIVSGAGGGTSACEGQIGANGGGGKGTNGQSYSGNLVLGASQINGYLFGNGEPGYDGLGSGCGCEGTGGGGGGYYGGYSYKPLGEEGDNATGGGGSGYIGNSSLTNKAMYCYNCEESTEESTKTISTTNVSETPISKYAKKGNGYARITIINE